MIKVYISGPYSQGVVTWNVRRAVEEADLILSHKYACHGQILPIVPHLCHLWDMIAPHGYEWWIEYTQGLLKLADVVIRLPGDSIGADGEVALAKKWGIPVFPSAIEFLEAYERGEVYCLT